MIYEATLFDIDNRGAEIRDAVYEFDTTTAALLGRLIDHAKAIRQLLGALVILAALAVAGIFLTFGTIARYL